MISYKSCKRKEENMLKIILVAAFFAVAAGSEFEVQFVDAEFVLKMRKQQRSGQKIDDDDMENLKTIADASGQEVHGGILVKHILSLRNLKSNMQI